MATDDLRSLFDAFYDRLVLRDFFGKVVPGMVLLSTVCASVARINATSTEFSNLVNNLVKLSFLVWVVIFGAAWLIAFAIQAFGEWVSWSNCRKHLIEYFPRNVFPSDESYFRFSREFQKKAKPDDRIQAERLVVIMEACGNGYLSLMISVLFVILYSLWGLYFGSVTWQLLVHGFKILGPLLLLAVFLLFCLWKMHRIHIKRLYD
jgi:multisubunit Na+/H+ antiporter MnhB subunit